MTAVEVVGFVLTLLGLGLAVQQSRTARRAAEASTDATRSVLRRLSELTTNDDRWLRLVRRLKDQTRAGGVRWVASDLEGKFVYSGHSGVVSIERLGGWLRPPGLATMLGPVTLRIYDVHGDELEKVSVGAIGGVTMHAPLLGRELEELHELVEKTTPRAADVIDDLLRELG